MIIIIIIIYDKFLFYKKLFAVKCRLLLIKKALPKPLVPGVLLNYYLFFRISIILNIRFIFQVF